MSSRILFWENGGIRKIKWKYLPITKDKILGTSGEKEGNNQNYQQ